jgi:hypothetical protein
MTECEEIGWTKEHEKEGWYNVDGRLVARWVAVSIPHTIIPHDANMVGKLHFVPENANERRVGIPSSEKGQWVVMFAHPDFDEVQEGDCAPVIATAWKK